MQTCQVVPRERCPCASIVSCLRGFLLGTTDSGESHNPRRTHRLRFALAAGLLASGSLYGVARGGNCPPEDLCATPQSCLFDGIPNIRLGNATLSINPACNLLISNIGSSGEDGVRQEPLPGDSTEMVTGLPCENFAGSVMGTKGRFLMFGDVPGGQISELIVENIDGQTMQTTVDFSPVGVTEYVVQIMIGDHMTANFSGLSQAVLQFPKTDLTEMDCLVEPRYHISYELSCVSPIVIQGIPATFPGNIIWIIGQNPTQIATKQTRIDNYFANTGPV